MFDIVVYEIKKLTDKIIVSLHPLFKNCKKVYVDTPVNMELLRSKVLGKEVAFIGSGFIPYAETLADIVADCTFILRTEDVTEDIEVLPCTIQNWFNYWCQLQMSDPEISKSIYNYTFKYPDREQRRLYQGLVESRILDLDAEEFIAFLKNMPTMLELQKIGKERYKRDEFIYKERLKYSRTVHLEDVTKEKKICSLTFGDGCILETACYLLEHTPSQIAIIISPVARQSPIRYNVLAVNRAEDFDVTQFMKQYIQNSSGSKFKSFALAGESEIHALLKEHD